jgi:metal-dependent amidase/aminoacylase/carboxypeptidase family protein
VLARLQHRLSGTVVFFFQPAEESLEGARAMLDDGVLERTGPEEIHALHCAAMPVGQFGVNAGTGLPGLDRPVIVLSGPNAARQAARLAAELAAINTVSYSLTAEGMEQLTADLLTPDGPLSEFVWLQTRVGEPDADGRVEVEVSYRCWPEERYVRVREQIRERAAAYDSAEVSFSDEPFPAMVCPKPDGRAVGRHLRKVFGPDAATDLHGAIPFSGEDFALFLDHLPGTYTYLGVRRPGRGILTSYPHFGSFDPDERAIGYGVRAMAGWLARRAGT